MKYFLVLALAVVGAVAAPSVGEEDIVSNVQQLVKTVLDLVPEPAIALHGKDGKIDLGFELLTFNSYDTVVKGIKALDTSSTTYDKSTGRLEYEWVFPAIEADVQFDLTLTGLLEAVNKPVIKIVLNKLKVKGFAIVESKSPNLLTDFKILATLDGAEVSLKGILNDAALDKKLEAILNKQLPSLVKDISVLVEPAVSPLVKTIINFVISLLG